MSSYVVVDRNRTRCANAAASWEEHAINQGPNVNCHSLVLIPWNGDCWIYCNTDICPSPPQSPHTTVDQPATSCPYATPYSFCKCSCELRTLDSNTRSQHLITESVLHIRTEN